VKDTYGYSSPEKVTSEGDIRVEFTGKNLTKFGGIQLVIHLAFCHYDLHPGICVSFAIVNTPVYPIVGKHLFLAMLGDLKNILLRCVT